MQFNLLDTQATYQRLLAEDDPQAREQIFPRGAGRAVQRLDARVRRHGCARPCSHSGTCARKPSRRNIAPPCSPASTRWRTPTPSRGRRPLWSADGQPSRALSQPHPPRRDHVCAAAVRPEHHADGGGLLRLWHDSRLIMTLYDTPTPGEHQRVEACTVHELHHNLAAGSDSGVNFNMMSMTVGEYMVMEGLAESVRGGVWREPDRPVGDQLRQIAAGRSASNVQLRCS